jgi:hypothetical protein
LVIGMFFFNIMQKKLTLVIQKLIALSLFAYFFQSLWVIYVGDIS